MLNMHKYIVGIDEAGRGPLAGPVAIGVVCISRGFDRSLVSAAKDSKQLSEKKREEVFRRMKELQEKGILQFKVSMVSAKVIDRVGITQAVSLAIDRGLNRLGLDPRKTFVKLDGLLRAPEEFVHQETIIKGDQKEIEISLASIAAKVTRDRYMVRMSVRYPAYGFAVHKGYGTDRHRKTIEALGVSDIHRHTFAGCYIA